MSRPGRRRADAERSSTAILNAAIDLLARRPQASVEEIAAAAGVSRQTVYTHYESRERLLATMVEHVTAEVTTAFDHLDADSGSARDALDRWLSTAWQTLARFPVLLTPAVAAPPGDEYERHLPITSRLIEILDRGRNNGTFDDRPPVSWLLSAIIHLGHAAAQEVAAGRMSSTDAGDAFRRGALAVCARKNPRSS